MDGTIFDFVAGASPWWWVAFGLALMALEMATFSYFLIWPGLAALVMGAVLWIAPGMGGEAQLAIWAVLAVGFTAIGRAVVANRKPEPSDQPDLNKRSDQLLGRRGVALDDFAGGEGVVEIDGVRWSARTAAGAIAKGAPVRVTEADDLTLTVTSAT